MNPIRSMTSALGAALLLCAGAPAPVLAAETVARQGGEGASAQEAELGGVASGDRLKFKSPMVLEVPFAAARPENSGQWITVNDMTRFVCDSVNVNYVRLRAKPAGGATTITMVVQTYTAPGHDKAVDITYELVSGATVIATATSGKINAEEKDFGKDSTSMTVATDRLPADADILLRMTLTVRDD